MPSETLRPVLSRFADVMEAKLKANDHKGGWIHCTTRYLSVRLGHELEELRRALAERTKAIGKWPRNPAVESDLARVIASEAADVANFAMMIADVCGGLASTPPATPGDAAGDVSRCLACGRTREEHVGPCASRTAPGAGTATRTPMDWDGTGNCAMCRSADDCTADFHNDDCPRAAAGTAGEP